MKLWKVVGLAGLAGVTATGIAVARSERERRHHEPDDVRARLRQRHEEAVQVEALRPIEPAAQPGSPASGRWRRAWARLRSLGRRRGPA